MYTHLLVCNVLNAVHSKYYTAVIGFGGNATLPHHVQLPLWKFIEKVNINRMDPWQAATESFGQDMDFLRFNSLAIAFRDADG